MKWVSYVVITFTTMMTLGGGSSIEAQEAADLDSYASALYEYYFEKMVTAEGLTISDFQAELDEENQVAPVDAESESGFEQLQYVIVEDDTELEILADIDRDTNNVLNLTFTLFYNQVYYDDSDTFAEQYDAVLEEAFALHDSEELMTNDQLLGMLGEPTSRSFFGPYEVLNYSINEDENDDATYEYVVVLLNGKLNSINEHDNNDDVRQTDFDVTRQELNQLAHMTGVNYRDMLQILGQPQSIFHDFANQTIIYVWYSDTDDNFSQISYMTDFRGIMLEIAHDMQDE